MLIGAGGSQAPPRGSMSYQLLPGRCADQRPGEDEGADCASGRGGGQIRREGAGDGVGIAELGDCCGGVAPAPDYTSNTISLTSAFFTR